MNWKQLKDIQRALDLSIMEPRGLIYEDTLFDRIMAAVVELGEVANEVRHFKFWSTKGPSSREIILEELVDVLHFVLSLMNIAGETPKDVVAYKRESLNMQFLQMIAQLINFRPGDSQALAATFMGLAMWLGFEDGEIEEAYMKKNEVNYKRQKEGY